MWPLSRRARPKQFHALVSEKTMLQESVLRLQGGGDAFRAPVFLASERHSDQLAEQLRAAGVAPSLVILEPAPRNTAPAIAALAVAAERENTGEVLVILPADHMIADAAAFREALAKGAPIAAQGAIVTFGVEPTRPETGYGYIRAGETLNDEARKVSAFVEKPDLETAERYVASGDYYWNAGIFMFRSDVMIGEMEKFCPKILAAAEAAVEKAVRTGTTLRLDADAFAAAPEDSIDYAVMEHTDKAAVTPVSVGWSDIGSWAALWEVSGKDGAGNVRKGGDTGGDAVLLECANTLAVTNGPKIAAIGVENLVIIATANGVLVAPRDRAQDVKKVVAQLKADGSSDLL